MAGNLYQRGKVWWARFQVRGREYRQSLRTTSRAEARKRLQAALDKAEHFRFYGENRHTWKEAVVEWGKDPGVKPTTLKRYLVSINQLRGVLDALYLDEIDRRTMSQVARRAGALNATRRRDLTGVSSVLRWCVAHGWCEENSAKNFDRSVIREMREPIFLPAEKDIEMVVARAPGNFARMIRLGQYTGAREEELASLEQPQIDLRRSAINLTRSKTNRPRSIPLDPRALGTLSGTPRHISCPYVFWHEPGARYMNVASRFAAITRSVEKAAAKAGESFRRFRFHDLRHWYAVDYLRGGGSIYTLQGILGHASIKTTEIYLDYLTPEEQTRAKAAQNMAQ